MKLKGQIMGGCCCPFHVEYSIWFSSLKAIERKSSTSVVLNMHVHTYYSPWKDSMSVENNENGTSTWADLMKTTCPKVIRSFLPPFWLLSTQKNILGSLCLEWAGEKIKEKQISHFYSVHHESPSSRYNPEWGVCVFSWGGPFQFQECWGYWARATNKILPLNQWHFSVLSSYPSFYDLYFKVHT